MSERTVCDFKRGAGWRASKSKQHRKYEYSEEVGDKVMQVRGLRGSENLVCKRE